MKSTKKEWKTGGRKPATRLLATNTPEMINEVLDMNVPLMDRVKVVIETFCSKVSFVLGSTDNYEFLCMIADGNDENL